jgi:CheY-like chemotaxis protein
VLSTASSEEAVQIATEQGAEIDLVFSDVVMPEVSGGEVSRRIARILPSAKFLFMSGYSGVEVAAQGVMSEGVHFIQKPFTRQALARKLREALG